MRAWKMITAVALVMAVSGTAWAVTVPGLFQDWNYWKSRNADNGSGYVVAGLAAGDVFAFDPSTLVGGVPTPVAGTLNGGPAVRTVTKFQAPGALDADGALPGTRLEDTWGIALLYQIAKGNVVAPASPGTIVSFTGPIGYDNSAGTQGTWLTAMFYGGVDTAVVVTQGNGVLPGQNGIPVGQQRDQAQTSGLKFRLWAVDAALMVPTGATPGTKDSVNLVDYVPGNRVDLDTYTGWTGDTIPGSVLLVTSTQQYFASSIVVDAAGNFVSNPTNASSLYTDIALGGPGFWNPIIGGPPNHLLDPLAAPGVPNADAWFQWTLDTGQRNWNVHSDDIGGVYAAIPEPVTILGVILGVGSLGGYIRRRFHA